MCSNHELTVGGAVDALADVDVTGLTVAQLQSLAGEADRASARLTGVARAALGELSVRTGGQVSTVDGSTISVAAWWRGASGMSPSDAGRSVRVAEKVRSLPGFTEAVTLGTIRPEHAEHAARLVGRIEPDLLADNAPHLQVIAERFDPLGFANYVRHYLATYGPDQLDDDERRAEDKRYVRITNNHDGTHRLSMCATDAAIETILSTVEPLARRDGDTDTRTAGQRRADAVVDVFTAMLRHGDLPDAGGQRPTVTFVVPTTPVPVAETEASAGESDQPSPRVDYRPRQDPPTAPHPDSVAEQLIAAALADLPAELSAAFEHDDDEADVGEAEPVERPHGRRCACLSCLRRRLADRPPRMPGPADLAGPPGLDLPPAAYVPSTPWTGPQTATQLATALCDAVIRVITLDPTGRVADLTDHGPTITRAQRRAVTARDRHCVALGCTRPPAFCDTHHLTALADGGTTTVDNLVLLCRRHHVRWHRQQLTHHDLRIPWHPTHRAQAPPAAAAHR